MTKSTLLITALLLLTLIASASADYLWPLPHGKELTSIFGSSRTRRYHAGIDVRTGGVIGKEVVAPADGFVSRLRASYFGYGKAVYLRLGDGNTAVFAHLSRFTTEVEQWMRAKQIATESYKQDLYPSADLFRFKRGQVIGYSGSTGVGAPHLHFEIRSPENVPLNPLKFPGLEVEDTSAPRFEKLRLIGLGNDDLAAALGWNTAQRFKRSGDGVFRLTLPLPCGGRRYWVSAEIVDFVSRNRWDKPTYHVEMRQGNSTIYELSYDELPFDENYRIEIDRNFQAAGSGDKNFYNFLPQDVIGDPLAQGICGAISDFTQPIEMEARDVAGNLSRAEISFVLDTALEGDMPVRNPDYAKLQRLLTDAGYMDTALVASVIPAGEELFLLIKSATESAKLIRVSVGSQTITDPRKIQELGAGYYLVSVTELVRNAERDLAIKFVVEQHDAIGAVKYSEVPCAYRFPWGDDPGDEGRLVSEDGKLEVLFPPSNEVFYPFDSHHFFRIDTLQNRIGTTYSIVPNDLPLAKRINYRYIEEYDLPAGAEFYADGGTKLYYLGAERSADGRQLDLKSYNLGTVTVRTDDIAPSIRKVRPRRGALLANSYPKVSCVIRDEMSGIGEEIEIRIDGRWIIPLYDFESNRLTAASHFELASGEHTLVIRVTDKAGNTSLYEGIFTVSGKN